MIRNLLFTLLIVLSSGLLVFSQQGSLKGKILDKATGEPIPFCNVIVEVAGAQQGGSTTDFDGYYTIKPIQPGTYDVKASYVGYRPRMITGVIIRADKITFLDVDLEVSATMLETVEIFEYEVPLIQKRQVQNTLCLAWISSGVIKHTSCFIEIKIDLQDTIPKVYNFNNLLKKVS